MVLQFTIMHSVNSFFVKKVRFLRRLSRQVQKSIGHTNAVAMEVISSILHTIPLGSL